MPKYFNEIIGNEYTGKCPKPEQFLKAEHLLKHAFPTAIDLFMVLMVKDD